jgi:Lar family restriction alleviation protein
MNLKLRKTDKLKPCPFCGCHDPELSNTHTPSYWIQCPNCGAEVHGDAPRGLPNRVTHRKGVESAIEKWNARV